MRGKFLLIIITQPTNSFSIKNSKLINMKKISVGIITWFGSMLLLTEYATAQHTNNSYQVGQKVEAYNVGWYKATIIEVGSGDKTGYIKVHYDDYSSASDQYLKESSIRILKNKPVDNYSAGPRKGNYIIQSYGGNIYNPLILGYFDLNNGKYKYYDAGKNLIGSGTYLYDANIKQVIWQSGELKKYNSTAAFEISREGKTHSIQLKRGTPATNSTDSK